MASTKFLSNLVIDGSGGTVLDVQGSVGQLFSVTDSLTGDLFAVSDISGIPILNVNSSGAVDIDGTLNLGDSDKIQLGASQDLQIFHNGSNSHIETSSTSTGDFFVTARGTNHDLYLEAADNIYIRPQGNENGVVVVGNGGVTLYHNNVAKLETTSTGVTVTGNIGATNFSGSSSGTNTGDQDLSGYSTASGVEDNADVTDTANVVAALTAGTNVQIAANGTISATDTNTTYTVGDGGLTQKNFTTTLKTKLDGIEASADVTDTANVVAALTAGSNISISAAGSISASNTDTVTSVGVSGSETTGTITLTAAGATTLTQSGGGIEIRSTDTQYTLPVAGSSIGGVKSGTDISVDSSGNVSVNNDSHTHDGRYYTETEMKTFFMRGYIESHTENNLSVGWYTIATNTGDRALAEFQIWDVGSGDHQSVLFNASHHYGNNASNDITVLANSRYSGTNFRYIRIKDNGTYDGAALQVYIDGATNGVAVAITGANAQISGWVLKDWIADATDPGDLTSYSSFTESCKIDLDIIIDGGIATTGEIFAGGTTTQYRVLTTNDEGSGNGLDADTLDGNHASAFSTASGVEDNADVTDTANVVAALTAGTNVSIAANGTISATDTNYYLNAIERTDGTNTLVFGVSGATSQSFTFGANAFNSTTIPAAEQYTAHEDTSTLSGTYGSTANGTKIDEITVDANGHITAISTGATGNMTGFFVEDGDGTEVQINNANEWKFVEGTGININWTDTDQGIDSDPYDLTFSLKDNSVSATQLNVSGNGTSGQVLTSDGDGTFSWSAKTANTDTITSVGISGSETSGTVTLTGAGATTITQSAGAIEIRSTDTNTTYTVGDGGLTQKNFTTTLKDKLDGIAASATNVTDNNQLTNGAGYLTAETFSSSDVVLSLSGTDVTAGESITLAGGLSYSGTTLTSANDNTTYTAGTGLTLTGTSFSVTANTYATAAQGTTADAALPKAGGTMTGGLTGTTATFSGQAHFKVIGNSNGGSILMGPSGSGVNKWSYLAGTHYNQDTGSGNGSGSAGVAVIGCLSTSTYNKVLIGGNPYEINPATQIEFWTHTATTHTTGGSVKMKIAGDGVITFSTYGAGILKTNASGVVSLDTNTYSTATGVENNADVTDTANVVAALTAGTNVQIAANGTISATDTNTTYSTADFDAAGSADTVQSNLDSVAANVAGISNQSNTDVDTGTETIAQVSKGTYTAAFFDFVIKNGTNVRAGTVYSCHDGTNVEFTETSTVDLGDTSDVSLSVDISGTNMRLRATTTSNNWSVKSLVRAI